MPSEHVPKVNVQIHIVVVLKNTKCNKHIREVAKVVLLMLWELSHCARTLEWRKLCRHTRRSSFTKLATVGIKPPPKDTYALGLPLQKEV